MNGKKIVEIPLAFDGYFDAVDYLHRWKILREKRKETWDYLIS